MGLMAFESQAIAASQDFGCMDTDGTHGSVQTLPECSKVSCGNDDKQKTVQDANDADTMDTLDPMDTLDEDEGSDGPWRSEESSEEWSEGDDSLLEPVKVVPEALQPGKGDPLEFVKAGTAGLPMYVPLSSENLPCTPLMAPPPGLDMPSQNEEKLATTCICGRDFALDANFCQKCGERRPKVDPSYTARVCRNFGAHYEQVINTALEETYQNSGDGDVGALFGDIFSKLTYAEAVNEITTFMISGIPQTCSAKQFREAVLSSNTNTIDFLYTPCDKNTGLHMSLSVINLVDPSHVQALRWTLTYSFPECEIAPAQVQGYNACTAVWGAAGEVAGAKIGINQQFQKTKMCAFFMKGKCLRGEECVYAHSRAELQQNPDLAKTRLCHNFLQGKCFEKDCKFAHGQDELRATEHVYKTVMCRWFSARGFCQSGAACRFAHTPEELRSPA